MGSSSEVQGTQLFLSLPRQRSPISGGLRLNGDEDGPDNLSPQVLGPSSFPLCYLVNSENKAFWHILYICSKSGVQSIRCCDYHRFGKKNHKEFCLG